MNIGFLAFRNFDLENLRIMNQVEDCSILRRGVWMDIHLFRELARHKLGNQCWGPVISLWYYEETVSHLIVITVNHPNDATKLLFVSNTFSYNQ